MKAEYRSLNLNIRTFKNGDLALVKELAKNSFSNSSDVYWAIRDLKESDKVFVAEINGKIVGTVEIEFINLSKGKHAQIGYIFTHKEYRGYGIASKLMVRSLEFLKREGFEIVWAVTEQDNFASRGLFRKFGFSEILDPDYLLGELNNKDVIKLLDDLVYWDGDVIMRKKLVN